MSTLYRFYRNYDIISDIIVAASRFSDIIIAATKSGISFSLMFTFVAVIFFFHVFSVFLSFLSFSLVAVHKKDFPKLRAD